MSIDDMTLENEKPYNALSEGMQQPGFAIRGLEDPPVQQPGFAIPEFLKAKTGPGSVEEYINHPMNIKKNEHFARMLRGFTGMFNSLDYAIIDVIVGALGFMKKPPAPPAAI